MTILLLSVIGYLTFLGAFLYAVGFIGGLLVPKGMDDGAVVSSTSAVLVNLALLSAFAVQHSVMARPAFKAWWTKIVHPAAERPIFVLLTNAILALMFWQWRPLPELVWNLEGTIWATILMAAFWLGWAIVFVSTFLLDHFELFGIKQGLYHFMGKPLPVQRFRDPLFYQWVRHPLMLGFVIAFWSAPAMSQGRLLFAAVTTAYILVAIRIEEKDLAVALGEDYRKYQRRVSMILPLPRRRAGA